MRNERGERRTTDMLMTALGEQITGALRDPSVVEIMMNPDGKLWIERHGIGRVDTGSELSPHEVERVIRLVATHAGRDVTSISPIVSAELPIGGERFEGVLPPVTAGPCFSIRKPAGRVISLDEYVEHGVISPQNADALRAAVAERSNILIVGGTGSGKTTLANALLAEIAETGDRVVLLEDTRELQCAAEDVVAMRTQPGRVSLSDLVRSTLRLRPDRIIIGEVRGGEALDMLKAWNTGHPGGIATLHANSAEAGLSRLEQLIGEATPDIPLDLIAEAVDCVVFIKRDGTARRVDTVARVTGVTAHGYELEPVRPSIRQVVLNTKSPNEKGNQNE
ncbi:MAG: P-type conjugative transfer ATPase TrbB [Pseudomonadota bacterium]